MTLRWAPGAHPVEAAATEDVPTVVTIRVPGLSGPVHDWFVVPAWLDAMLHTNHVVHEHHPGEA